MALNVKAFIFGNVVDFFAKARQKKAALRKILEQVMLEEVYQMDEEMQALNKKLEEIEVAIEEYFMPLDEGAEALTKIKVEGEENRMKQMLKSCIVI